MFNGTGSYAQFTSPYLSNQIVLEEKDSNTVQLTVYMNNYLKNNEYFGPLVHGYTLFGTMLRSGLAYVPNEHLRIEGGVFLQNDFGSDNFSTARPFFSLKLKKKIHTVIFGNLEGASNHELIDPLFDQERSMTHPFENGLQYKTEGKWLVSDSWIDWVRREDAVKNIQEEIHAGINLKFYLLKKGRLKLSIPVQGIVWHLGGQLNAAQYPVESIGNGAAGIRVEAAGKENSFLKRVTLESFALNYIHSNHPELRRYPNGNGYFSSLSIESTSGIFLNAGYFFGHHFITETGADIYQSVSQHYGTYYENYREVLTAKIGYRKEFFPGMWIDVRFEPYYDIGGSYWEYAYSGFITYKKDFHLKTLKK